MKVFISARFDQEQLEILKQQWEIVGVFNWAQEGRRLGAEELVRKLDGVDVLITEIDIITDDILARCPALKVVVDCRGNPVNVDVEAATKRGILLIHTPGRNADAVADLTVALMIMLARRILPASRSVTSGQWATMPRFWAYHTFQGIELGGRKVGLIGLGAIGRKVAQRLGAFNMEVLAYDPYVSPEIAEALEVHLVPLEVLLRESDFISLHVHVTEETKGMIGEREFALMKPTAYLINTARAAVIDEAALYKALRERRIAGAALDVYHTEPLPPNNPLLQLDNVVLTPHIGGATEDVVRHQSRIVVEELQRLRAGKLPRFIFNEEVLPRFQARLTAFSRSK